MVLICISKLCFYLTSSSCSFCWWSHSAAPLPLTLMSLLWFIFNSVNIFRLLLSGDLHFGLSALEILSLLVCCHLLPWPLVRHKLHLVIPFLPLKPKWLHCISESAPHIPSPSMRLPYSLSQGSSSKNLTIQ